MTSLRNFKTLIAVARSGSLSAAADLVSLTPAAVSLQMTALEAELGQKLFDRAGKTVTLNAQGFRAVESAQKMIDLYDRLRLGGGDTAELSGLVSVGTIATAMGILTQAILAIQGEHPRLTFKTAISFSDDLVARVNNGELDAALSPKQSIKLPAGVTWTPLYEEPFVLVANRASSRGIELRELFRERLFLRMTAGNQTGATIDRLVKAYRLPVGRTFELDSIRTMVELAEKDVGITIVPALLGAPWIRSRSLRVEKFEGAHARRSVGIFEGEARMRLTSVLRDHLRRLQAAQAW